MVKKEKITQLTIYDDLKNQLSILEMRLEYVKNEKLIEETKQEIEKIKKELEV